jgi:hypothetical protein
VIRGKLQKVQILKGVFATSTSFLIKHNYV